MSATAVLKVTDHAQAWGEPELNARRGYAPFAVYFDATESTGVSPDDYQWNFGDGSGEQRGGFNAVRIYDEPGVYVCRVFLGAVSCEPYAAVTIEVLERPEGLRRYVDEDKGDDTWEGSATAPWATADSALDELESYAPGTEILFKRGQTFNVSHEVTLGNLSHIEGVHIGAYGEGAKPVLQLADAMTLLVFRDGDAKHLSFEGLRFEGGDTARMMFAQTRLWGISWIGCEFVYMREGFTCSGNYDTRQQEGLFWVDCVSLDTSGNKGAHLFLLGARHVALIDSSFNASDYHVIYAASMSHSLVRNCYVADPSNGRTVFRLAGQIPGSIGYSEWVWITDNAFKGSIDETLGGDEPRYTFHVIELCPNRRTDRHGNLEFQQLRHIVFKHNEVRNGETLVTTGAMQDCDVNNNWLQTECQNKDRPPRIQIGMGRDLYPMTRVNVTGNYIMQGGDDVAYVGLLLAYDYAGGLGDDLRVIDNKWLTDDAMIGVAVSTPEQLAAAYDEWRGVEPGPEPIPEPEPPTPEPEPEPTPDLIEVIRIGGKVEGAIEIPWWHFKDAVRKANAENAAEDAANGDGP